VKSLIRRLLRTPNEVDVRSHVQDWIWKRIFRVNTHVPWPVHFTSRVVGWEKITCGRGSYPGDMPGCYIQGINGIVIGENCQFGPGVGLISANHDPADLTRHLPAPPIRIGDRCWIGMNAVILPGVELGPATVVGAGSVVTRSFPDGNCMIAGNPASVVREQTHVSAG
jgi:acetyltransferase-like isoleucine patch superfamily enzyme